MILDMRYDCPRNVDDLWRLIECIDRSPDPLTMHYYSNIYWGYSDTDKELNNHFPDFTGH